MSKHYHPTLRVFLASLALAGTAAMPVTAAAPSAAPLKLKALDPAMVTIIRGATRAEVFRVDPYPGLRADKGIGMKNNRILENGKNVSKEFIAKLAAKVLDPSTYRIDNGNYPTVAIRLWKGQESVEILYCSCCGMMRVERKDAGGQVYFVQGHFGRFSELNALVIKESFPGRHDLRK